MRVVGAVENGRQRHRDYLRLEFPSRAENIGVARLAVASFASRLPFTVSDIQHDLRVAVSETVTNVVVHAYPKRAGRVVVEAWVEAGRLIVTVQDWGKGFDPAAVAEPDPEEEHMGIGLQIVRACMDKVEIDSAPGRGTLVRMEKAPAATAADQQGAPHLVGM
ncbi:MAG TPA: anti-sigma F factor [Firmicutes bacterium]|nr:anti-sigma F factor [Bacillota bacterium]